MTDDLELLRRARPHGVDDARDAGRAGPGGGRRVPRARDRRGAVAGSTAELRRARAARAVHRRARRARRHRARSTPAPAAPTPRTGPRCCCACTCAGPSAAASTSSSTRSPRAPRPASRRPPSSSRAATPTGCCAPSTACTGWSASRPFDANARRQTAFASVKVTPVHRGRRRRARDRRQGPAHRHVPLVGRRRPARQRDRLGGAHHAPADRHRRVVPERAVASTRTRTGRCRSSRPSSPSCERQKRKDELAEITGEQLRGRLRQPDPHLRAAAVPAWSRTSASGLRDRQRPDAVLDGDLDGLMEAYLQWQRAGGVPA